jgi:hypothetical protein
LALFDSPRHELKTAAKRTTKTKHQAKTIDAKVSQEAQHNLLSIMRGNCTALVTMLVLILFETWDPPAQQEHKSRGRTVRRRRRTVSSIMCELGGSCKTDGSSLHDEKKS